MGRMKIFFGCDGVGFEDLQVTFPKIKNCAGGKIRLPGSFGILTQARCSRINLIGGDHVPTTP
ncbi:MAG: hypothetical protein IBX69_00135 [Anaerolineales bacterium]|nr:hypothetical protein [Anaerolineales bacterium]